MMMTKRQWKNLLQALHNEHCILLLGPAISSKEIVNTLPTFAEQLAVKLAGELEEEGIDYDQQYNHNLTYIAQCYEQLEGIAPLDTAYEAQDFYQQYATRPNLIHQILAQLPFHLIINTTPDDLMLKAMQQAGRYQTQFCYYSFDKNIKCKSPVIPVENLTIPTEKQPILYNLFGYYEDPESLVITEQQRVLFTSAIVQKQRRIPPIIASQFDANKTYLFLGFDWEQWHLPLLLSSFKLPDFTKVNIFSTHATQYPLSKRTKDYYKYAFKFRFVKNELQAFAKKLSDEYQKTTKTVTTPHQNIVISSTKEDEGYKNQLCKNLRTLESANKISIWHKNQTLAGRAVEQTIRQKMQAADLILLLISADYLASSDFQRDFSIAQQQKAPIIPIIVRPCAWDELPKLRKLHRILPNELGDPGKPIALWKNEDEAYHNITEEIKCLVESG